MGYYLSAHRSQCNLLHDTAMHRIDQPSNRTRKKNHINDDSLANVCQQFSIHMNNTQYRNSAHVYKHNFLLSIMYVVRVQRKCTQGNDNWNKTKNCNCALAGRLAKFTRKKCAVFLFGSQTHYFCSPIKSEKIEHFSMQLLSTHNFFFLCYPMNMQILRRFYYWLWTGCLFLLLSRFAFGCGECCVSPKKEVRMYGCASTASILHGCLLEVVRVYACSNISEREKKRKTKRLDG